MDVGLVCDSCSSFNPMGAKICARCGDALSLDEPPKPDSFVDDTTRVGMETKLPAQLPCPACGDPVVVGHKFCGHCGFRMPSGASLAPSDAGAPTIQPAAQKPARSAKRKTQFFGAMQASRAKLVVIKGDGMDGVSFTLAGDEHLVGRADTPILFEEDVFISPVHANFYYDMGTLMVRDENSANGVYIRIQGTVDVQFSDRFLVGEQVLQVQAPPPATGPEAMDDGTYYFTSPPKPGFFRVVQTVLGGADGMAYHAYKPEISIGREGNDIDFPTDPFISGNHARLSVNEGKLTLTDLDSKNGTFLRINGEHALKHGDYVFMGQQLLRVEIV
jgi:pSer/pThr/pTyr-binding forkhead associated (FHA) protein